MYLLDTNIILEVLLRQKRKEDCKNFMIANRGKLQLSDFTLFSIGIQLFRKGMASDFKWLLEKFTQEFHFVSSIERLGKISEVRTKYQLDFDDSYQFLTAKENNLTFVTMDLDFKKASGIKILFL